MARDETAREPDQRLLDRRSYLQLAGAAAASVATFGATSAASTGDETLLHEDFSSSGYDQSFTSTWRQGTYDGLTSSPAKTGDNALQVDFPQGGHYGISTKFDPVEAGASSEEVTELYASYWVRFDPEFDGGSDGSKLPGPLNTEPGGGKGGEPSTGTNGWSARGSFIDAGSNGIKVGFYTYHMDMSGSYGDYFWATAVPRGEWVKIDQHIDLNTVSGGSANSDGRLRMWVNGSLEVDRNGMRFTEEPERGVNYQFASRYGGNETSPKRQSVFFDRLAVGTSDSVLQATDDSGTTTGSDDQQTDDGSDEQGTVLEIVAHDDTPTRSYAFTVDGSVSKRTDAGDLSAEGNDYITDNGDGTVTVEGEAGKGYGDSYLVDGVVTSMDIDESLWTLRYGGEEVSVSDIVLPNTLVIDGSDTPRQSSTYTFKVSGSARKSAEVGSINDHDTVENGEINGRVIGGTDGFRFSGEITSFRLDGPATVRVEDGA